MVKKIIDVILWIVILMALMVLIGSVCRNAYGEEMYVICRPDDVVLIRESPGKTARATGELKPGDEVGIDGKKKNGWIHLTGLANESGEGWVSGRHLTWEQPVQVNHGGTIVSAGRVAARKWIDGPRVKWLKPGSPLTVYYMTETWCVTSKGYVRSEYIALESVEDD